MAKRKIRPRPKTLNKIRVISLCLNGVSPPIERPPALLAFLEENFSNCQVEITSNELHITRTGSRAYFKSAEVKMISQYRGLLTAHIRREHPALSSIFLSLTYLMETDKSR